MDAEDLIWIEDATKRPEDGGYGRSRAWLEGQMNLGHLAVVKIPGDRRTYLKRGDLESLLRPREERRGGGTQATG